MKSKKIQLFELTPEEFKHDILQEIKIELAHFAREIKPKPETIWLSRNEACDKLGVSLVTLYKWNKAGVLPAYKIGGSVRYKLEDINAKLSNTKKRLSYEK